MRETIRIGRIAGIPVGVNWTVGLIAMLLVSSLAGTILPLAAPGLTSRTYILVGVVAALGFFGSILAHELGHSIVAIRRGVPVDGITLWLLGGVARLRKEPEDARTELMVASAGPATSAALAVGLGITAIGLGTVGLEVLAAATAWLATINVILAVFNLIPAAPLDGGRILAGVLWLIHGDRDRAKWTATSTGRAFGVLLIAVAVWSLTAGGGFGVWALMLGFFVLSAANGERRVLETRRRLAGLTVRQAMSPLPIPLMWAPTLPSVRADAFVTDVVPQLANGDVFVVDELGRAIGTVGLDHLARLARFGPEIAV